MTNDLTLYWTVAAGGLVLAAAGMVLRKSLAGRLVIPNGLAIGIGGFTLGLGLGCGSMHLLGYRWTQDATVVGPAFYPAMLQPPMQNASVGPSMNPSFDHPLAPGKHVPSIRAEGWLNVGSDGPPDVADRVVVVDVWAEWCPVCREAAGDLIAVHRKYRERGVIFVTLTMEEAGTAGKMVESAGIPWPVGYGASETMRALVGTAPTVFVIDRDGRIAWHDDRARFRHDIGSLPAHLDQAIDETLAKSVPR
ncbi:MAG TPA: TlpA disulfide reductase family protein [Pirellulales bacterium]|nr:TlpA disulfide reductase family protein [Pirellulales bacterium]